MLESEDLILAKAVSADWKDMYENVWSRKESARYMFWSLSENEEDARARMERTIAFQKSHDTWLVYEKKSGKAIGFAGLELREEGVCQETGICLGPGFVNRGYGKQILSLLIKRAREVYGADKMVYCCRKENEASIALAKSMGFKEISEVKKADPRDGSAHLYLYFEREI